MRRGLLNVPVVPTFDRSQITGWERFGLRGLALICALAALGVVGVCMLYSIEGMTWTSLPETHAVRLLLGVVLMVALAFVPVRWWMAGSYPAYAGALVLLIGVEMFGKTFNGAQRWIDIGPATVQPSEMMKLAVVLALAKYYHQANLKLVQSPLGHVVPLLLIGAPALLIAKQPDLGTALLVVATGGALVFLSGVRWTHMIYAAVPGLIGLLGLFVYGLEDYQRQRLLVFFNPNADLMGAGYNIQQSKIAIGSGGLSGKGWGQGTQAQLDFIPELETDFIFPVIAEELGLIGGVAVLALAYGAVALAVSVALTSRIHYARMVALGVGVTYALYVVINVAMTTAMAPVVGVPFPLVSNGGTVMLAVLCSFGAVLAAQRDRDRDSPRNTGLF